MNEKQNNHLHKLQQEQAQKRKTHDNQYEAKNIQQKYITDSHQQNHKESEIKNNQFQNLLYNLESMINVSNVYNKQQTDQAEADAPLESQQEDDDDEIPDQIKNNQHHQTSFEQSKNQFKQNSVEIYQNIQNTTGGDIVNKEGGFTNMNKERYRKSSKENFLQRQQQMIQTQNQGLNLPVNNIIRPPSQSNNQLNQNNIIIDLTNQLYEESKTSNNIQISNPQILHHNQQNVQAIQADQQLILQKIQDQIPKDIVTQKDINEFKKQIQIDLQKLTQILEENTKKQYIQAKESRKINQRLEQEKQEILGSVYGGVSYSQQNVSASQIEISPNKILEDQQHVQLQQNHMVNKSYQNLPNNGDLKQQDSLVVLSEIKESQSMGYHSSQILNQQKSFSRDDSVKIPERNLISYDKQNNKAGPQAFISEQQNLPKTNQSVNSQNTYFSAANSQKQNSVHKSQNSQQILQHQRKKSAQGAQPNNQFYLNLQNLQNQQAQNQNLSQPSGKSQSVYQQALYSTGFRNKYNNQLQNLKNMRSNSREQKSVISGYQTKSPKSYSSMTSYNVNLRSANKSNAKQNQNGNKSYDNKSKQIKTTAVAVFQSNNAITEEENQIFDNSVNIAAMQENEDLKQQLHLLRLKNAEHRGEIQKVKRDNGELLNHNNELQDRCKQHEKQRKKDCDYILKQENEMEKLIENKQSNQNLIKVQEEQIANLKVTLNSTINVKIKYENIIKRLVQEEKSREYVLAAIEQVQQSNQQNMQYLFDNQSLNFNNSMFFGNTMISNQFKSAIVSGHTSLNQTQNISQILQNAAARVLGKSQRFNKALDGLKPQDINDFDEGEEIDEEEEDVYGNQQNDNQYVNRFNNLENEEDLYPINYHQYSDQYQQKDLINQQVINHNKVDEVLPFGNNKELQRLSDSLKSQGKHQNQLQLMNIDI
eukprot:403331872